MNPYTLLDALTTDLGKADPEGRTLGSHLTWAHAILRGGALEAYIEQVVIEATKQAALLERHVQEQRWQPVRRVAAKMVRLEGGCERGHRAGSWHIHEEPFHSLGRELVRSLTPPECPVRSSVTDQPCLLPAGHAADSPNRFHRYAIREGT